MPPDADRIRLQHMLDAAREAVEIVGEAASKVTDDTQRLAQAIS